ncbi:MAG: hypothetical protein KGY76_07520 [Candidatus Thermoplasmatota archaeon]|nr:hypothetical protein [Candidatus Thermoplasmatota archaeon]
MSSKDAFERVTEVIEKIREPGEKPEDDLYSMDKFVCDLCQGIKEREQITQCGFCGRWVCKDKGEDDCWNEELNACESCSGLITLAQKGDLEEETDLKEENDSQDDKEDEDDKDE